MVRQLFLLLAVLVVSLPAEMRAQAIPYFWLIPSLEWQASTPFPGFHAKATAVAIQPDDKVVVVGAVTASDGGDAGDFAIARYLRDGTLDSSFGNGGTTATDVNSGSDIAETVLIQPDGKILVIGCTEYLTWRYPYPEQILVKEALIVRYLPDGTLDSDFGEGGKILFSGLSSRVCAVVQPDGKILFAYAYNTGNGANFILARLQANGLFDPTFNYGQSALLAFTTLGDAPTDIALQSDGKIVISGKVAVGGAIIRYCSDGQIDGTFGLNGVVAVANTDARKVLILPDNRIVIAGKNGSDLVVSRFSAEGLLDVNFGQEGVVTTVQNSDFVHLLPRSDGMLLLISSGSPANFIFPSGTFIYPDGGKSRAALEFGYLIKQVKGVAATRSGSVIGAGFRNLSGSSIFSVVQGVPRIEENSEGGELQAPLAGVTNRPTIDYTLSEGARPGTLKVLFQAFDRLGLNPAGLQFELTLSNAMESAGRHTFSFDPADPVATSSGAITRLEKRQLLPANVVVAEGGRLPDGQYNVKITWQDVVQHNVSTLTSAGVKVDTYVAPLTAIAALPVRFMYPGSLPDYYALSTPSNVIILPGFDSETSLGYPPAVVTQNPPAGTILEAGTHLVTVTRRDAVGNESTAPLTVYVRSEEPVHHVLARTKTAPPDVDDAQGPPFDAVLRTLGVPVVDDLGHVSFTGQWASRTGGPGRGIFVDGECMVKVGDVLAALPDAPFKTFSDPVADDGRVAFVATLGRVPGSASSVVVSDAVTGTLQLVARTGGVAPGTGGAKFKRFKAVAIRGKSVAVYGELIPGTGSPRVKSSETHGVWVIDETHSLTMVLRQGQEILGQKIKTLGVFAAGNGSPGHGRGWLSLNNGVSTVRAFVTFGDGSQAVLQRNIDGTDRPLALANWRGLLAKPGGVLSFGPGSQGVHFHRLGNPSGRDAVGAVFLGTIKADVGSPPWNMSRNLFFATSTSVSPLAQVGEAETASGATFVSFKDPVMSEDGTLAFFATMKGTDFRGLGASTIWSQGRSGLKLTAQGGTQAAELSDGARWKTFTSLAVAPNRGPMFSATLIPGKGGVTRGNASGAWAMDFAGTLRLLFRTGDMIDGKKLTGFTILNAVPGSLGVTRAFNDHGQIVWRAQFSDGSTAIVQTEAP